MKKLFWLIAGIATGMAVAKQIETNPKAKALADDVKRTAIEFGTAFAEGFAEREAELSTAAAAPKAKAPVKKPAAAAPKAKAPVKKPAAAAKAAAK
jgi:hypothetical protein